MSKFLKFGICGIDISIELSHLIHVQRMFNAFANTVSGKHSTFDKLVVSSDVNKNLSVLYNKPEKSQDVDNILNQIIQLSLNSCDNIQIVDENNLYCKNQVLLQDTIKNQVNQQYNYNKVPQPYWSPCYSPSLFSNLYRHCYNSNQFYQNIFPSNILVRQFHTQQVQRKKYKKHKYIDNSAGTNIMSLRLWENTCEKISGTPGFIFTLMSYNVLAQDLVEQHPYLYKEHDLSSLSWPTRWKNLFEEISQFKPDILCLQEVQESHIVDYYSTLKILGYDGIFKKRTGSQSDGCAIYYKSAKVKMVDYNLVQFYQSDIPVLNRDNVGIVAKFVPTLHPTREFVVATTHLLYNPRRDDVRMAQMHLLLTDIEKMSYKNDKGNIHYLPIILTGDFNSPPHSDLYEFITHGDIKYENLAEPLKTPGDHRKQQLVTSSLGITDNSEYLRELQQRLKECSIIDITKDKDDSDLESSSDKRQCDKSHQNNNKYKKSKSLSHNFGLKSVYKHGSGPTAEGTTHQDEWLTVDYIFYSIKKKNKIQSDKLQLLSRYRLPLCQELQGVRIPNSFIGSDHLSLIAKFKLEF